MKDEIIVSVTINNSKYEFADIKELACFFQEVIEDLETDFEIETTLLQREHALEVMKLKLEIRELKKKLKNEKRN
jgi:hypothetical protein